MSTPLGHALVGLGVAGLASALPPTRFARGWGWTAACVGLAVLPDADHAVHAVVSAFPLRGPTHSCFGAGLAAVVACAAAWRLRHDARAWLLLPYFAAAGLSHVWLDYNAWIWANGVQAGWPFDSAYHTSAAPLFPTKPWLWGPPSYVAELLWTDVVRFAPVAAGAWGLRGLADVAARGWNRVRHGRTVERPLS